MRRGIRDNAVTLKHVQTQWKGGKAYRYLRLPGQPAVRLPDLASDRQEFLEAYLDATRAAPIKQRAAAGSIGGAIEAFLRSDKYKVGISENYRRIIRKELDAISTKVGSAKAVHLESRHIKADIAALPVNAARLRRKAWRLLCKFMVDSTLITSDPSDDVKAPPPNKTDGHAPWTPDDIAKYRAHWPVGTIQRRAMELMCWTAARISDAVNLGPGMVGKDGVLAYRQKKTKQLAYVPWSCALPEHADAEDHAHCIEALAGPVTMTFLETRSGQVRSYKAIGGLITTAARAAKVNKSAHGLRKYRAVSMAERRATTHQIAAWTGHGTLSEVDHYTTAANRRAAGIGTDPERKTLYTAAPSV